MAIQEWTILKLVGPVAIDAANQFSRWQKARRTDDNTFFSPEDWSPSIRRTVTAYLDRLAAHRCEPPIVYFSQHIDLWSAAFQIERHLPNANLPICHNLGDLYCYRLPDRRKLVRRNTKLGSTAQFAETAWLARRLMEATDAYSSLWPDATLLINRHMTTASQSDKDLQLKVARQPRWLRTPKPSPKTS